jgi:hypothetical protein
MLARSLHPVMLEGINEPKYYLGIPRGLIFSVMCLALAPLVLISCGFLLFSMYRIAYNITTNEQANHARYSMCARMVDLRKSLGLL